MFHEFAYSRYMQVILAAIAFSSAFIVVYFIAELIFTVYGESADIRKKALFAFFVGVILNEAWIYAVYLVGGMNKFSNTTYVLVVTPNPVFALLYYLLGVTVLKLSPLRSVKLMGHIYLYYLVVKAVNRLLGSFFFEQTEERYNFLIDAVGEVVYIAVFIAVFYVSCRVLRRLGSVARITENLFVDIRKEALIFFMRATAAYIVTVSAVLLIEDAVAANIVLLVTLLLIFLVSLLLDLYHVARSDVSSKDAHISVLTAELRDTVSVELPELVSRLGENPSLISILISGRELAQGMGVDLRVTLRGGLDDFYIGNIDACVLVDCLLCDAIEIAARSSKKWVCFAIEPKSEDEKLIIVNNSAPPCLNGSRLLLPSQTTIRNRHSNSMSKVRRIISVHGNCALHFEDYSYETIAYLKLRRAR